MNLLIFKYIKREREREIKMPLGETIIIICAITAIFTLCEMAWVASKSKNGIHSHTVYTKNCNELIIDHHNMILLSSIVNYINSKYTSNPSSILSVVSEDENTLTTPLLESYKLFQTNYGDIWIKTNHTNKTFDSFTLCWKRSNSKVSLSNINDVILNLS